MNELLFVCLFKRSLHAEKRLGPDGTRFEQNAKARLKILYKHARRERERERARERERERERKRERGPGGYSTLVWVGVCRWDF